EQRRTARKKHIVERYRFALTLLRLTQRLQRPGSDAVVEAVMVEQRHEVASTQLLPAPLLRRRARAREAMFERLRAPGHRMAHQVRRVAAALAVEIDQPVINPV